MEALRARKGTKPIPVQFPLEQQGEPIPQHLTAIATKGPRNGRPAYVYVEDEKYVYQRREYGWIRCRRCQRLANPPDGDLSGSNDEEENGGCGARWILEDDGFYHFHPHDPRSGVAHNHGYDRERIREIFENPLFPRAIPRNMNNPDGIALDEVFQELNLSGNNVNDRDERYQFLEARNQTLEETNAQSIIEIDDLKRQLKEKDKQLMEKDKELGNLQTRFNQLNTEKSELQRMNENLQKTVNEKQARIDTLQNEFTDKESTLEDLRREIIRYEGRLEKLEGLRETTRKSCQKEIDDLRSKLDEAQKLQAEGQTRLGELTNKIDQLETGNAQHLATINQRETEINGLRTELRQMGALIAELKNQLKLSNEEKEELKNEIIDLKGRVRVFLLIKPRLNEEAGEPCIVVVNESTVVHTTRTERAVGGFRVEPTQYKFDLVLDGQHPKDLFSHLERLIVLSVVHGDNTLILAYGPTGAGKTHTMEGTDDAVIQSSVSSIFTTCESKRAEGWAYTLKLRVDQIYLDEVKNLVGEKEGLAVSSERDVLQKLAKARQGRKTAETLVNPLSSRSHLIVTISICGVKNGGEAISNGEVCFADLAGAERVKESGAEGIRFDEAKEINKSLMNLCLVIAKLRNPNGVRPDFQRSELTKYLGPLFKKKFKIVWLAHVTRKATDEQHTKMALEKSTEAFGVQLNATGQRELAARPENVNHSRASNQAPPRLADPGTRSEQEARGAVDRPPRGAGRPAGLVSGLVRPAAPQVAGRTAEASRRVGMSRPQDARATALNKKK